MNKYLVNIVAIASVMFATSCSTKHFVLKSVEGSRILIDSRYDAKPDAEAAAFLAPYQHQVDSIMGPVVGKVDHNMAAYRPESDLSNLLADIMVWAGKSFNEHPDVGVYNMGGIRAGLSKGEVTYGDVLDLAPFENKLCFITLKGDVLKELFSQIASLGGEGVSHGVELVIDKSGKLLSARLNGNEIDENKEYRVATIDYLVQGNDGLKAFLKGTNLLDLPDKKHDSRFIIMDYFREKAAQGIVVNAKVEGRIKVN